MAATPSACTRGPSVCRMTALPCTDLNVVQKRGCMRRALAQAAVASGGGARATLQTIKTTACMASQFVQNGAMKVDSASVSATHQTLREAVRDWLVWGR